MPVLLLLLPMFFSPPTRNSSSSNLCSPERFSDLVLLLLPLFYFFGFGFSREAFGSGTSSFISGSSLHRHLRSSSSMELKFHVAKTSPCQQSELKSLKLNFFPRLEFQRLEMLFSSILSDSC